MFIRQNLPFIDSPHTERIKIFIMAVDPSQRYSNESKRVNKDIYDDFKLKKNLHGLYKIFQR